MSHFAKLNPDTLVVELVLVGRDDDDENELSARTGDLYRRTSYNTRGNQHPDGTPFRGNYAGIGYRYDDTLDAFIPPQPFPSWTLDEATFQWAAPVPYPDDGEPYVWDESALNWTSATLGD